MFDHRSRLFGDAARAGLLSVAVLASILASGPPAGAQESSYPESTDLTVAETSDVTPLTPGVRDQWHAEERSWLPYGDGFARVVSDGDSTLTIESIDREGGFTTEELLASGAIGNAFGAAINDEAVLIRMPAFVPDPVPAALVDRGTGVLTNLGLSVNGTNGASMSDDGGVVVSNDSGEPFWLRLSDQTLRTFEENDNGMITYDAESPVVDGAGTVVVAIGHQVGEGFESDVMVVDRLDPEAGDEVRLLACAVDNCEHEIGGIHVDGFFTNIYVGTFELEGGPGTARVNAKYQRFSSNVVPSMPVSAISQNGRFLVGNSQSGDGPEPTKTKVVIYDTETERERVVSIQGLVAGQTVFPLAVSNDGLFIQYEAYVPCAGLCLITPSYTGWFELEATAPVTNGPAADQIQRLYRAVFGRSPEAGGFEFWVRRYRNGESLLEIATAFAASQEFVDRFGADPTDLELINGLYQNVLNREGDAGGVAFWLDRRANGTTVAQLLVSFADSPENIDRTGTRAPISVAEGRMLRLYRAVFGRAPDEAGMQFWVGEYSGGQTLEQIAARFMTSPEFNNRFGDMPSGISLINGLYINVLGRRGDPGGVEFWTGRLESGTTIPQLLVAFADSPENVVNTGTVS